MDFNLFTKDPFTDYLKIASAVVVSLEVDRTSPGLRYYVGVPSGLFGPGGKQNTV